jgi:lysophospholipase L1-like esterase
MRWVVFAAAGVLVVAIVVTATLLTLVRVGYFEASPLGGDLGDARGDRLGLRVLFVGNSLTYENDMPGLLRKLVASDPGNEPLFAVRYTPGGYTLAQDTENDTVAGLLTTVRWNDVVLQEQSGITESGPDVRAVYMDPSARELASRIRAIGARPLLFMTWGDRTGSNGTYGEMQDRVTANYRAVANELDVPLVPVGLAWAEALRLRPGIALWEADGHHPSLAGAYLDACVFYAFLYHRNPASSFTGGLTRADATFLQRVAKNAV